MHDVEFSVNWDLTLVDSPKRKQLHEKLTPQKKRGREGNEFKKMQFIFRIRTFQFHSPRNIIYHQLSYFFYS